MNALEIGLFYYYFNILAITGIVYFLLAIVYQRSKRVIINTAEQPFTPDNTMVKWVFKIAIVAILWFFIKEYGFANHIVLAWEYVQSFFGWTSQLIAGIYNG